MARRLSWLLRMCVAGALVIVLGGCLRYHVELTVSADQRVSGTVIVALKTTDPHQADRYVMIPPDLAGKVTTRPYAQDGYLGETLTLHRLTFDQVGRLFGQAGQVRRAPSTASAGPTPTGTARATVTPGDTAAGAGTGPTNGSGQNRSTFTFRRVGEVIRVNGVTTFPVFDGVGKDFDARITLTFPGDVVSTNGQRHGRTVTWRVSPDKPTRVNAVARLSDAAPTWMPLAVAGGGALLVVLGGLLAASLVRRRRAAVPVGAAPEFDAVEFQTFLDDRSWYPPAGPADPTGPGYRSPPPAPLSPQSPPSGYPGYPGQPGYPAQPGQSGYGGYPNQPGGYPGEPGQPGQQGQQSQWPPPYPEPPHP